MAVNGQGGCCAACGMSWCGCFRLKCHSRLAPRHSCEMRKDSVSLCILNFYDVFSKCFCAPFIAEVTNADKIVGESGHDVAVVMLSCAAAVEVMR